MRYLNYVFVRKMKKNIVLTSRDLTSPKKHHTAKQRERTGKGSNIVFSRNWLKHESWLTGCGMAKGLMINVIDVDSLDGLKAPLQTH